MTAAQLLTGMEPDYVSIGLDQNSNFELSLMAKRYQPHSSRPLSIKDSKTYSMSHVYFIAHTGTLSRISIIKALGAVQAVFVTIT